jgi:hypothetical protein
MHIDLAVEKTFDRYSKMTTNQRNRAWERFRVLNTHQKKRDTLAHELAAVKQQFYEQFLNKQHHCLFAIPCREESCKDFFKCGEEHFYKQEFTKMRNEGKPYFGDARYLAPLLNPSGSRFMKIAIINTLLNHQDTHKAFVESTKFFGFFKYLWAKIWYGIELVDLE